MMMKKKAVIYGLKWLGFNNSQIKRENRSKVELYLGFILESVFNL